MNDPKGLQYHHAHLTSQPGFALARPAIKGKGQKVPRPRWEGVRGRGKTEMLARFLR